MVIRGSIKLSIILEKQWWVGIFERIDEQGYSVAREIFGAEPTDAEIYQFVLHHQDKLKFSRPLDDSGLVIKKLSPKRLAREVRAQQDQGSNMTKAQDALRIELEKNKKEKKTNNSAEKERVKQFKFDLKQKKRKAPRALIYFDNFILGDFMKELSQNSKRLVLFSMIICLSLIFLDQTAIPIALLNIQTSLHATIPQLEAEINNSEPIVS